MCHDLKILFHLCSPPGIAPICFSMPISRKTKRSLCILEQLEKQQSVAYPCFLLGLRGMPSGVLN